MIESGITKMRNEQFAHQRRNAQFIDELEQELSRALIQGKSFELYQDLKTELLRETVKGNKTPPLALRSK